MGNYLYVYKLSYGGTRIIILWDNIIIKVNSLYFWNKRKFKGDGMSY